MGVAADPKFGARVGGYIFIGRAKEHPFTGEERWRVECAECGASCVRLARSVAKNTSGCKRCALSKTKTRVCARAGSKGGKAKAAKAAKVKGRKKRGSSK